MAQRKDKKTARVADDMIGAAQILERAAKDLKATAKHIRAEGLLELEGVYRIDCVENQRTFKASDIKNAAARACAALGMIEGSL